MLKMSYWSCLSVTDTPLHGLSGLTRPTEPPPGPGKPSPNGYGPQVVPWPEHGDVRYVELGGRAYFRETIENEQPQTNALDEERENTPARELLFKHARLRRVA